jgi:hypothetical protein
MQTSRDCEPVSYATGNNDLLGIFRHLDGYWTGNNTGPVVWHLFSGEDRKRGHALKYRDIVGGLDCVVDFIECEAFRVDYNALSGGVAEVLEPKCKNQLHSAFDDISLSCGAYLSDLNPWPLFGEKHLTVRNGFVSGGPQHSLRGPPQGESENGDEYSGNGSRELAIFIKDVDGASRADSGTVSERERDGWRIFLALLCIGGGLFYLAGP